MTSRAERCTLAAALTAYRGRRFTWLFASLLLTLAAGSTLAALASHYNLLQLLLMVNLLAAVASVAHEYHMRVPLVLGIGYVAAQSLRVVFGLPGMLAVSEALWLTVIALATVASMRHALARGRVDTERLLAALDAYLLAGLLFAVAYWMLDRGWPASFGGATVGKLELPDAIYFSFITIATLGYGDVVPVSPPARGLAMVEAVSGQMYMAVLVARLVSLYSRQRED
jgi:ion channel